MSFWERLSGPKNERKEIPPPKMEFHVSFGYHGTPEQLEGLQKDIKGADVYVPEAVGHDEQLRLMYQAVSDGYVSPEELSEKFGLPADSPDFARLKTLHGAGVRIFFADLPEGHKLLRVNEKLEARYGSAMEKFLKGRPEKAVNDMRAFVDGEAEALAEREAYIRERLEQDLPKLVQEGGPLAGKSELRVVMDLGIAHTDIYHELRKNHPVTRAHRVGTTVFSAIDEAVRRKAAGKEVPDELLARESVDYLLINYCLPTDKVSDFGAAQILARALSSRLTLGQIGEISRALGASSHHGQAFEAKLEEYGVIWPKTLEEADRMLEKILGKGSRRFREHALQPVEDERP